MIPNRPVKQLLDNWRSNKRKWEEPFLEWNNLEGLTRVEATDGIQQERKKDRLTHSNLSTVEKSDVVMDSVEQEKEDTTVIA